MPYGETVDDDEERLAYYRGIQNFAAERVVAAIGATWPDLATAPDHIRKASATPRVRAACATAVLVSVVAACQGRVCGTEVQLGCAWQEQGSAHDKG